MFKDGYINPFKGKKHSIKTKNEISRANTNPSKETKEKMKLAKEGKYLGINNPFYGKRHSEETKKKIGKSNKGKKHEKAWNSGLSNYKSNGSPRIIINGKRISLSHHIWLTNNHRKTISTSQVIHHIDLNPYNNHLSNLKRMDNIEHKKLHIRIMKELIVSRNLPFVNRK